MDSRLQDMCMRLYSACKRRSLIWGLNQFLMFKQLRYIPNKSVVFFGASFLLSISTYGQVITRGPYLQSGSPSSIIIRWRTDLSTNSYVQYGHALGSLTNTVVSCPGLIRVEAESADNAPTFTTAVSNITARSRTFANVDWNPSSWTNVHASGIQQRTSDLSGIVQEVIDRPGWTNGNSMVFVLTGKGGRLAESYDGSITHFSNDSVAPLLHVEYTNPNGTNDIRIATSSDDAEEDLRTANQVNIVDTDLNMTDDVDDEFVVGLRFNALSVPPGATISSAYIQFTSDRPDEVREHEVCVSGLTADTQYYYNVGDASQVLAGGDTNHYFVTAPVPGTMKPTRIWALGDSGFFSDVGISRDAFYAWHGSTTPDLWMMLGDNAYNDGTDAQYQSSVFNIFQNTLRTSVLWPTLGNHDARNADSDTQSGIYYDVFSLPRAAEAGGLASGTEAYYSFDYANIHFICLDSHDSDRSTNSTMITWMENDVLTTTQQWIIAFWHHPPYTKGSHDSDIPADSGGRMIDMRENALPILESAGVDLILGGHSHAYERSFFINGHYGFSSSFTNSMIIDSGDGKLDGDGCIYQV